MADADRFDVVALGSNVAVLVAGLEAARAGRRVLVVTDGRPLGGHFRGLRVDDADFDIGRVMVERADSAVVATSAPRNATDEPWTAHGAEVDEVLLEHLDGLHRTPTPESHVLGRRWPDHVTANRLDVMAAPGLPGAPMTEASDELHARHKMLPGAYDALDYAAAAAANHGPLHEVLFEPFVRKVVGVGSSALVARHHRYAWTPLYWPESLRAARTAQPESAARVLPEYPFFAPRSGFTGELVRGLEAALRAHPRAHVLDGRVEHLVAEERACTVTTAQGTWRGGRLVLGLTPVRAAELLGLPAPAPRTGGAVTVVFARVRARSMASPVSCLYLCDPADRAYRISDHEALGGADADWHRVVVEGGGGPGDAGAADDLLACARRHLGVDDPADAVALRALTVPDAKPVPTAHLVTAMAEESQRLRDAAPGVVLTGSLLHHGAAALSDQVAQGWRAAHEVSEMLGPARA